MRTTLLRSSCVSIVVVVILMGVMLFRGQAALSQGREAPVTAPEGPACCTCVIAGLIGEFIIVEAALDEIEGILEDQIQVALGSLDVQIQDFQLALQTQLQGTQTALQTQLQDAQMALEQQVHEAEENFIRFEIETMLYNGECVPSLWLPLIDPDGVPGSGDEVGKLEFARDYVMNFLIPAAAASGDPDVDIISASVNLDEANDFIASGQFTKACKALSDAVNDLSP